MRWAEEPCTDEEYHYRLGVAARIYVVYTERNEKIDRAKKRHEEILADIYNQRREKLQWQEKQKLAKKSKGKKSGKLLKLSKAIAARSKARKESASGTKRRATSGSRMAARGN